MASQSLQQSQPQVDEVMNVVHESADKASKPDDQTEELQAKASRIETSIGKEKRTTWWKNMKIWHNLIYGLLVLTVIVMIWSIL